MRLAAKLFLVGILGCIGTGSATAQNLEQFFDGIGRLGQPRRAVTQADWEKISPGELLCVDNRLRRNRRSVNTLIDRGIGPSDRRVADIVSECRAAADATVPDGTATPSFNCNVATQPDEQAICGNNELARLDRAVVEGYEHVLGNEGAGVAKGIAEPLLRRRHGCGPDLDCIKRVQLTAIAAFQARGAPVQVPAAAQVTARDNAAYVINGMSLGGNVQVGSTNYLDYACAPSQHYAGFTACQRQTIERSRRRRISESTAFLHNIDGSAVYINQSLEPVVMDDNDARDEIGRLSEMYGKATLLPVQDARGVPSGLIATWGAVSMQPMQPERRAALATGTDDGPGILVDSLGDLRRSAQLGLPIYQVGGGAGHIWAASWNGRGRGTLRMLAIDASKLPGAAMDAKTAEPAIAVVEAPKPAATTAQPVAPPVPPATVPAPPKPVDPAPVAPQPPKSAAPAPADIRVVGPPIELRPNAPAVSSNTTPAAASDGNGLVIFLIALVVVLLGAVGYLWRKSRMGSPADAPAEAAAPATVVAPKSEKMDLPALVPAESPDSIAASKADMEVPKDAAMTSVASDVAKRDRADPPIVVTSGDK